MKVITTIIVAFVLVGCSNSQLESINIDNINKKIDNETNFRLYVGSDECPSCPFLEENLIEISKEHKSIIYKLDVSDFQINSDEIRAIEELMDGDLTLPVTLVYENGEMIRAIRGAQPKSTMVELMLEE